MSLLEEVRATVGRVQGLLRTYEGDEHADPCDHEQERAGYMRRLAEGLTPRAIGGDVEQEQDRGQEAPEQEQAQDAEQGREGDSADRPSKVETTETETTERTEVRKD
jgi:hypothetical protein